MRVPLHIVSVSRQHLLVRHEVRLQLLLHQVIALLLLEVHCAHQYNASDNQSKSSSRMLPQTQVYNLRRACRGIRQPMHRGAYSKETSRAKLLT